jgi:hypothetical protein
MGEDRDDFDVSAALLRRGNDNATLVSGLADRLARAVPDRVTVRRGGLLRGRAVRSVTVEMADARFRIELEGRRPSAWMDAVVRGVCIRSVELSVDDWVDRLAAALSDEARRSVELRLALQEALQ